MYTLILHVFFYSEFQFPQNLNELKNLAKLLRNYQQQKPFYVFALFCSAYLYKQTFAIPGSVFMVSELRFTANLQSPPPPPPPPAISIPFQMRTTTQISTLS
jgi:hypothetical protein